jgi:hypothetical protein
MMGPEAEASGYLVLRERADGKSENNGKSRSRSRSRSRSKSKSKSKARTDTRILLYIQNDGIGKVTVEW